MIVYGPVKFENLINYSELLYRDDNYKDQIIRHFHKEHYPSPVYKTISETDTVSSNSSEKKHKLFKIGLVNPKIKHHKDIESTYLEQYIGIGKFSDKKTAQQMASKKALQYYKVLEEDIIKQRALGK